MQSAPKLKQELKYPSFSIVIEWGRIFQSDEKWRAHSMLQTLCKQIIGIEKKISNVEILIVFDPEEADLSDVEKFVMKELEPCIDLIQLRFIRAPGILYYEMKNLGVKQSSPNEIIMFVDSDIVPDDGWLVGMLESFENPEVKVVSGNTYLGLHNIIAKVLALITFQPIPDVDYMYERNHFYGQNVAFRRKTILKHPFPKLKTFHGQADVLINDLVSNNIKIYRQPKIKADHPMPITLREFVTWGLVQGLVWLVKRKAHRNRDTSKIKGNNPSTFRQIISRTRRRIRYVGLSPKVFIAACGIIPAHLFLNFIGIIFYIFWPNSYDYMTRKKWRVWI